MIPLHVLRVLIHVFEDNQQVLCFKTSLALVACYCPLKRLHRLKLSKLRKAMLESDVTTLVTLPFRCFLWATATAGFDSSKRVSM
jgi:hypothetical protein